MEKWWNKGMNITDRLNAIENGWTPEPKEQIFKTITKYGSIEYRNSDGQLHNISDLPAKIDHGVGYQAWFGYQAWYRHGKQHRDNDLPAVINDDGTKYWYKNGLLHRDGDKPAIEYNDGSKHWYKNGVLHRDNDLPAVINVNDVMIWLKNGLYHRDNNLPAVIRNNGNEEYWVNGERVK